MAKPKPPPKQRRQYIPSKKGVQINILNQATIDTLFDLTVSRLMMMVLTVPNYPEEAVLTDLSTQFPNVTIVRCDGGSTTAKFFRTIVGKPSEPLKTGTQIIFLKWRERETPFFHWLEAGWMVPVLFARTAELCGNDLAPFAAGDDDGSSSGKGGQEKIVSRMKFSQMTDSAIPSLITTVMSTEQCPYCNERYPHESSTDWSGKPVVVCRACGVTLTSL